MQTTIHILAGFGALSLVCFLIFVAYAAQMIVEDYLVARRERRARQAAAQDDSVSARINAEPSPADPRDEIEAAVMAEAFQKSIQTPEAVGNVVMAGDIVFGSKDGSIDDQEFVRYALVIEFPGPEEVRLALRNEACRFTVFENSSRPPNPEPERSSAAPAPLPSDPAVTAPASLSNAER